MLNSDTIPQVAVIADGGQNTLSVATYTDGNWTAQHVSGSVEFRMNPLAIKEDGSEPEVSATPPPLSSANSNVKYDVTYIVTVPYTEQRSRTENRIEEYVLNNETRTRTRPVEVAYTVKINREEMRSVVSDQPPSWKYAVVGGDTNPVVECQLTTFQKGGPRTIRASRIHSVQIPRNLSEFAKPTF